jgi:cytochrome b pre-mRNA-processing protein 3
MWLYDNYKTIMLSRFFKSSRSSSVPHDIYGAVVTQSRLRCFYTDFDVPDTVIGRLELLCMHMFLVSHMLVQSKEQNAVQLNQEIFDIFTADLDRALREIGIGDTAVPKRKKRMVHTFFAHIDAFAGALDAGDRAMLAARLNDRVYSGSNQHAAVQLAVYMQQAYTMLKQVSYQGLTTGKLNWPSPEINCRKEAFDEE